MNNIVPFRRIVAQAQSVRPVIVGFCGRMHAGKSTAAGILADCHGFARTRFAAPLKAMLRVLLASMGVDDQIIARMIEGDLKDVPSPLLCGRTPRHAMQTLGTEWGRGQIGPSLWTGAWQAGVTTLIEGGITALCVEDVRFPNEVDALHELGGTLIRVTRGAEAPVLHVSEQVPDGATLVVDNTGTPEDLAAALALLLPRIT